MASEDIIIRMGMDSTAFNRGLQQAKRQASEMQGTLSKLGKVGSALGVGLGVGAVLAAGKALADYSDELQRVSDTTGATIGQVQAWQFAAAQNGASAEDATTALDKLNKTVGEARGGNAAAAETFKKLGINLTDVSGRAVPTGEVLNMVSAKLAGISDPAQRAAIATDLFSKAGVKLLPALLAANGGLKELEGELERAGLILLPANVKAINEATDALALLGMAAKASAGNFLGDLVRATSVVSENLAQLTGNAMDAKEAIGRIGSSASMSGANVGFTLLRKLVATIADLKKETADGPNGGFALLDPAQAAALESALTKLDAVRRRISFDTADDAGKLVMLQGEVVDLHHKLAAAARGSAAAATIEAQILEKQNEARRVGAAISKQQTADAEKRAALEKQAADIVAGVNDQRIQKLRFSRDELRDLDTADMAPAVKRQFDAQKAALLNVETLEGIQQKFRNAGNEEQARRYGLLIEQRLANITKLKDAERFPFLAEGRQLAQVLGQLGPAAGGAAVPLLAPAQAAVAGLAAVGGARGPDPLARLDAMADDIKALRALSEGNGLVVQPRMAR